MTYLARASYTGNGSNATFSVSFPYLDKAHIKVTVNGVPPTVTWITSASIQISPVPVSGAVVKIVRETRKDARVIDFQNGSTLAEADLDTSDLQNFYLTQEAFDTVTAAVIDGTFSTISASTVKINGYPISYTVGNIAALRALVVPSEFVGIAVGGYYTPGDGGGGIFTWDASSSAADDGGLTILPTGYLGVGRWKRAYEGALTLEHFGAKGDNTAIDTPAIIAALATGQSINGTRGRTYKTTSTITFSNRYQMLDLNGATIAPNGTFSPAISITQVDTGPTNGSIDGVLHSGNIISNPTELQHLEMDKLTIVNSSAGFAAVILKDIYTSNLHKVRITNHRGTALHAYTSVAGQPVNSMWFDSLDVSGGTSTDDSILFEGATAFRGTNLSCQNNLTGSTDVRIKSTVNAGVTAVQIDKAYFETGINNTGNCIYIGDPSSGTNTHVHCQITNSYFQASKQPIRIGTYVNEDTVVDTCTFLAVTGGPTAAITVSGSPQPMVRNCSGSLQAVAIGANGRMLLGGIKMYWGIGSPEGAITAPPGSVYLRTDAGGTTFYVKQFNTTSIGWIVHPGWNAVPVSASDAGVQGMMAYDTTYLYICTAGNTWRRILHATW